MNTNGLKIVLEGAPWRTLLAGTVAGFFFLLSVPFSVAAGAIFFVVAVGCFFWVWWWYQESVERFLMYRNRWRLWRVFGEKISGYEGLLVTISDSWLEISNRLGTEFNDGQEIDFPQITDMGISGRFFIVRATIPTGLHLEKFVNAREVYEHRWRVKDINISSPAPGFVDFRIPIAVDPLEEKISQEMWQYLVGDEFFSRMPVAFDENYNVINLDSTHTLFIGGTGSGKGSGLWAVVRAGLPARLAGNLRFFGAIDPKNGEFSTTDNGVSMQGLFDYVAYREDEIIECLSSLRHEMDLREGGRSFAPSVDRPWLILCVDEITSLFDGFNDSKAAKNAEADLRVILSQGRSKGVIVVGAGQEATKEKLRLRDLFPQRVAYRVANPTETNLVLGDTAVEMGAVPHEIPEATPSNDYASAGIAFVRTTQGAFVRTRFIHTTDADIERIAGHFEVQQVGGHDE